MNWFPNILFKFRPTEIPRRLRKSYVVCFYQMSTNHEPLQEHTHDLLFLELDETGRKWAQSRMVHERKQHWWNNWQGRTKVIREKSASLSLWPPQIPLDDSGIVSAPARWEAWSSMRMKNFILWWLMLASCSWGARFDSQLVDRKDGKVRFPSKQQTWFYSQSILRLNFIFYRYMLWAVIAQSVSRLATGCTTERSEIESR
jgi:hypothetical protein